MPAPNPYTLDEKPSASFICSAAKPTLTRSRYAMKYSSARNGTRRRFTRRIVRACRESTVATVTRASMMTHLSILGGAILLRHEAQARPHDRPRHDEARAYSDGDPAHRCEVEASRADDRVDADRFCGADPIAVRARA